MTRRPWIRWRRIEIDRLAPGRWQVRWVRSRGETSEEMRIDGPPSYVLRLLPHLLRWRWSR